MNFKVGDRVVIYNNNIAAAHLIGRIGTVVDRNEYFGKVASRAADESNYTVVLLENSHKGDLRAFVHNCYRLATPLDELL